MKKGLCFILFIFLFTSCRMFTTDDVTLNSISIEKESITLQVGEITAIGIDIDPHNYNKTVSVTSSDTSVITVGNPSHHPVTVKSVARKGGV